MTTATLDLQEILADLALENPKILYGVSWEDYVGLVESTFGKTNLKTTYNRGVLKIMGQGLSHENLSRFLHNLITLAALYLRQNIIPAGSMSLISHKVRKGADPDESYYIQNANLANLKDELFDDESDTPPDLVIEIDKTHESADKFEIYAAFGIKEFWLYDAEVLRIFKLSETGEYLLSEKSAALPILTAKVLTKFLNRSQTEDQFKVLKDFQIWLEENKHD
jgi:Uma2 family endonuclease